MRHTSATLAISALIFVFLGGATLADSTAVHIESGRMGFAFDTSGGTLRLKGLSEPDGPNWLSDFNEDCVLWALEVKGPDGKTQEITSRGAGFVEAGETSRATGLRWEFPLDRERGTVDVTVRLPSGESLSRWSLKATLPEGWQVTRADFPVIPNIRLADGLKLAVPVGWGLEYDVSPSLTWAGTYPSLVAAMQFVAFYGSGKGLYIGLHDANANHKFLQVKGCDGGAGFTCTNLPVVGKAAGRTYKLPYEAVIGVFDGDYWDAAQIYRDFTFKTAWGKAAPVSKRPIPQWLKDTELWLKPEATPLRNVDACVKAADFFGVPISLHWYNWHEIPFDTLYPEYVPAKRHFEQGVKALKLAGFHSMPYINARLCDPKSKTWTEEGGEAAAARKEDGEPYTEVYGSKVPLNVMCPYTTQWQQKVGGLVDRLVNECGVDGVYADQICAAGAVQCFDGSHGHPVGGGHFWVDGYRRMLDLARAKLPKDRILTTEENAECWIDQFDALLLVNTPATWATVIPLFPAVYAGRTITFGFQYISNNDPEKSLPFRLKMARAFTYGAQLGWIKAEMVVAPENIREAEFLRNLARCRRFGHEYLLYGRFLGELDVAGDNPRISGDGWATYGGDYKIETPAVLASAWLAEDGSVGVALANLSDEDRKVEFDLPLKKAGCAGKKLKVKAFGPEGEVSVDASSSAHQKLIIPGRSGLIIRAGGV